MKNINSESCKVHSMERNPTLLLSSNLAYILTEGEKIYYFSFISYWAPKDANLLMCLMLDFLKQILKFVKTKIAFLKYWY